jgi:hypothetical protein
MTTNPFYNAIFAIAYIVILVTAVNFASTLFEGLIVESIFLPMGALATLVLSVALMGYLFFYQPVTMLIDDEREKAVKLFLQTVAIFAVATVLVICIALITGYSLNK